MRIQDYVIGGIFTQYPQGLQALKSVRQKMTDESKQVNQTVQQLIDTSNQTLTHLENVMNKPLEAPSSTQPSILMLLHTLVTVEQRFQQISENHQIWIKHQRKAEKALKGEQKLQKQTGQILLNRFERALRKDTSIPRWARYVMLQGVRREIQKFNQPRQTTLLA